MPRKAGGRGGLPDEALEMLSGVLGGKFQAVVTPERLLQNVMKLPLQPEAGWLVAARPVPGLDLPGGDPLMLLVLALHTDETLLVDVLEEAGQERDALEEVGLTLLDVMLQPEDGAPAYRPARILTPDAPLALLLGRLLRKTGIQVERATLPGLEEMLGQAVEGMRQDVQADLAAREPRPFLTGLPDEEVRALVAAFGRFMRARVWDVFPADKPLYAHWENADGSSGQVYATVMGELGETFGLALYPDWLTYADHLNNGPDMEHVLEIVGSLEALTLGGQDEFAPEDWATLGRLKLVRGRGPQGPSLLRMGLEGACAPRTPVHPLTVILNALADRAERRSNTVTSLKAGADGVQLRFPASPRDELSAGERAGSVELTLRGGDLNRLEGRTLTLTAPADTLLAAAFREGRKELKARGEEEPYFMFPHWIVRPLPGEELEPVLFGQGGVTVWRDGPGQVPLTLAHLTRLRELQCSGQIVQAVWQPEPVQGVTVTLTA